MKLSGFLLRSSVIAALGGFLFGFDTVVISGADKTIQALWQLSELQHGLAMSMALWGTVLGSLIGFWPTDRFGRKKTLLSIGLLYFVSAVWSGLATDVNTFMIARFIGGLGVGISTIAAPLYISEISPADKRGRLAGMFQFNIVFGILIAFISNYLLGQLGDNAWRWMLGVEAVPALAYTVFCMSLSESPRWLIAKHDDRAGAQEILKLITPEADQGELDALTDEIVAASEVTPSTKGFWCSNLRIPILLAFLIAFFNQLSGINAVLYFAPRIFGLTGLDEQAALLQSVGIGLTNLLFTFVGLYLIDRLGRRTLLYIGSVGYIVSLGLVAGAFLTYAPQFDVASKSIALRDVAKSIQGAEDPVSLRPALDDAVKAFSDSVTSEAYGGEAYEVMATTPVAEIQATAVAMLEEASALTSSGSTIILVCIFGFIAAHAVGQGAVIWVFISEIFPNQHRAAGQSLGSGTHWVFAALLTMFFPVLVTKYAPGYVFGFFCFMMCLQLVWVRVMVPETKGVPLEDIQKQWGD